MSARRYPNPVTNRGGRTRPAEFSRMPSIVAFDLETTGLDPKSDAIIEIAMVRFDENGTIEEFSSLVNP